jgi:hypothetical protein
LETALFNDRKLHIVTMKKLLCFCCGLLVATVGVRATTLFSDTFTYPNGDLVGNGGWVQTGTIATTPIQVASGSAVLFTGQDVQTPVSYTLTDGTPFFIGATINVQSAMPTGDYFLHWSTAPQSSIFVSRVEIRSSGAGYNVGYVETSGTGASLTWGPTEYSFNTDHSIVLQYNPVTGTVNDTADLYVDGTLELSDTWGSQSAESTTLGTLNLRQGAANAPGLHVDNLILATTFAEAYAFTQVPEPTTLSLLGGFGLLALLISRRRR